LEEDSEALEDLEVVRRKRLPTKKSTILSTTSYLVSKRQPLHKKSVRPSEKRL
jgi:hypothetical protein